MLVLKRPFFNFGSNRGMGITSFPISDVLSALLLLQTGFYLQTQEGNKVILNG